MRVLAHRHIRSLLLVGVCLAGVPPGPRTAFADGAAPLSGLRLASDADAGGHLWTNAAGIVFTNGVSVTHDAVASWNTAATDSVRRVEWSSSNDTFRADIDALSTGKTDQATMAAHSNETTGAHGVSTQVWGEAQYTNALLLDGSRSMVDTLNLNRNSITNVSEITLSTGTTRRRIAAEEWDAWQAAYGWGNHATNGYGAGGTFDHQVMTNRPGDQEGYHVSADVAARAALALTNAGEFATARQGASADTAFGWGEHGTNGYLSAESDPVAQTQIWAVTQYPAAVLGDSVTYPGALLVTGTASPDVTGMYTNSGTEENLYRRTDGAFLIYSNWEWGIWYLSTDQNPSSAYNWTNANLLGAYDSAGGDGVGSPSVALLPPRAISHASLILLKGSGDVHLSEAEAARVSMSLTNASEFATAQQGASADTAYGWGSHATNGYLTSAAVDSNDYPCLRLELGGQWTDFEIKASTNNFTNLVYYYISSGTNNVADDPDPFTYYTDDHAADVRAWIKATNHVSLYSQLISSNTEIETVYFFPSHSCQIAWTNWMWSTNDRLVWSWVRFDGLAFELNASGTKQHWNPVRPERWERTRTVP